ncbi:MAG: hypothetical protein RLZZ343_1033, partial [Actinomycetota bacterium]
GACGIDGRSQSSGTRTNNDEMVMSGHLHAFLALALDHQDGAEEY